MMQRALPLFLIASAVSLLPATAAAQSRSNPAPITTGTTTGDVLSSVERLRTANATMQVTIDQLEVRNTELLGRIETLEFLLSESGDEVNRLQVDNAEIGKRLRESDREIADLETRLARLEAAFDALIGNPELAASMAEGGVQPGETVINSDLPADAPPEDRVTSTLGTLPAANLPGEAGPLFQEAQNRLLRFDYEGAEQAFRAFIDQFGDDPQAGEARYWLGEALYQQGAYAESGAAFTEMLRAYPDNERAPDALVKLARSLRLVGDTQKACIALDTLPKRYADASQVTQNLANVERVRSACDG